MKEVRILTIDNRGRIVIPQIIRKSLGLTTNSQLMMIADSETKEIKISPVGISQEANPVKFRITMKDIPGALAKIANIFAEKNISLIYGTSISLEREKTAMWEVIGPLPSDRNIEDLEEMLLTEGEALKVEIVPLD
ncbi:MAG: hypothetical protein ACFFBP_17155 [Promethearchaeota archaeon]